jgi:hypothetical protein
MLYRAGQRVLVDTNVIIEAHRTGCWQALSGYFALETVEKVIEETQTGAQNRSPESVIDETRLRASIRQVASISDQMRAAFHLTHPASALDPGERDLLIYAGTVPAAETWLLNSPDMAVIRHAHERGWLDRLVSLESMNGHLKGRLSSVLRTNYTEQWLSIKRTRLLLG